MINLKMTAVVNEKYKAWPMQQHYTVLIPFLVLNWVNSFLFNLSLYILLPTEYCDQGSIPLAHQGSRPRQLPSRPRPRPRQ